MGLSQYAIRELIGEKDNITIFEIGCADGGDTKRFLNTFGSNLKIYTFDPEPINIKYGEFAEFDGNKCTHGNKINNTGYTRISFDFRIVPLSKYDPEQTLTSESNSNKFIVGEYYKELK